MPWLFAVIIFVTITIFYFKTFFGGGQLGNIDLVSLAHQFTTSQACNPATIAFPSCILWLLPQAAALQPPSASHPRCPFLRVMHG